MGGYAFMKKWIQGIITGVVLLLIIFYIIHSLSFRYSDGIMGLDRYYELPDDSVDLLVLGSSHAFEDINTAYLYDNYGISSFILAGSIQPMWNTYYYLEEALDYQTPQMIVLEAYTTTLAYDYSDNSRIIKNNYGIRNPYRKYQSLRESVSQDEFDDYYLEYRQWHSRYTEMAANNYDCYYKKPLYQYFMGFGVNFKTTEYERNDAKKSDESLNMKNKSEKYYRRIIELCQEKNIPLVIVVSPYIVTEREQKIYNYAESIAKEYDVPFVNYNSDEYYDKLGIDFQTDFADQGHLNYIGNVKYTSAIAELVTSVNSFEDHRNDSKYLDWQNHSKDVRLRVANQSIKDAQSLDELKDAIAGDESVTVYLLSISGTSNPVIQDKLRELYSDDIIIKDGTINCIQDNNVVYSLQEPGKPKEISKDIWYGTLLMRYQLDALGDNIQTKAQIFYNGKQYIDDMQGVYLVICNDYTQDLVRVCQLTVNGDEVVITEKSGN